MNGAQGRTPPPVALADNDAGERARRRTDERARAARAGGLTSELERARAAGLTDSMDGVSVVRSQRQ